jgi:hypothetical protein
MWVRAVNRVQKTREGRNVKLGDVASKVLEVSGRAIPCLAACARQEALALRWERIEREGDVSPRKDDINTAALAYR